MRKCTMFMLQGCVVRQRVEVYNVHGIGGGGGLQCSWYRGCS